MGWRRLRPFTATLLAALALGAQAQGTLARLPAGVADASPVAVSGISSGGYMAVQLHMAHAEIFQRGVGVVAGGPLDCAEGSVLNALGRCMKHLGPIPVDALVAAARQGAAAGRLAPLADVARGRVYLFSGTHDETVNPLVMADLQRFYGAFVPAAAIQFKRDMPASHSFVTEDFGAACGAESANFFNDCDFDLAGALLGHLHGDAAGRLPQPRSPQAAPSTEFDQREFVTGHALLDSGRVFIPAGCTVQAPCALHVALHGCKQNTQRIATDFSDRAGYNRWAQANRIIVLYPQAAATEANPNGCWDWWGHDDARYATREGPQVRAVVAMVNRLRGRPADPPVAGCSTAGNWAHARAGRADLAWGWARAKGSGQALGWWWQTRTLREWPAGRFDAVDRCD